MQLSKRLKTVAEFVTQGNRLVDVGCDHGYLPVYLVMNQKIPGAVAMDVRTGPLSRAKENIKAFGLDTYIETRLSDGLKMIQKGEGDTLTIAGMGGPLMEKILREGEEVLPGFRELILQPQSDVGNFRRFLHSRKLQIIREDMVYEEGKFYPVIKAVWGEQEQYEPWEFEFGKLLLKDRNPVLYDYLKREERLNNRILEQLEAGAGDGARKREQELRMRKEWIREALRKYEM